MINISGREPLLDGQLQSFCTNTVALLGIALGTQELNNHIVLEKIRIWLSKFISNSFQTRLEDWEKCLLVAVCHVIGIQSDFVISEKSEVADVRIVLKEKKVLNYEPLSQQKESSDALYLVKKGKENLSNFSHIALRLAAFESIQKNTSFIDVQTPKISDVSRLLRGVPSSFRRWTWEETPKTKGGIARKWFIDNEYHVQNFLYSLLCPIFPDLKEEDYTPSVGQKNPRIDLGIPSLELIIEVKFMRPKASPQKMIDQIAADASLQLVEGSPYKHIIAFIWDDSCRTEEHKYMENGLKQLSGVIDAIVISRPGNLISK